jgi:hypothetical protein
MKYESPSEGGGEKQTIKLSTQKTSSPLLPIIKIIIINKKTLKKLTGTSHNTSCSKYQK